MKFSFWKFVLIIYFLNQFVFGQNDNRILGKIGSDIITVDEFKNRFEFMPHFNYSNSNIDTIKKEFLYSLIAEKLWALEANALQLDTIETIKHSLHSLKNLFIKDELYKQEVESKVVITNDEISKGLSRVTRLLSILIITSADSIKIWNLYNTFLKEINVDFDSVLKTMNMPQRPFEVKYGSFEDETVEDILYSLKLNEISKPIKSKNNWFIFKLINDEQDASIDLSKDYAKNIVIKKIRDRKSQTIGRNYLDNLLGGKSITADRRILNAFSEKLFAVIKKRSGKTEKDSLADIQLLEKDILKVLSLMNKADLSGAFIQMDDSPATLKDFLYYLMYQKIHFDSLTKSNIKLVMNRTVKRFIEDETIVREGYRRRFENLPTVKNDLQIWKNYYLTEVLMSSYSDSINISESEIEEFIRQENNLANTGLQVNIIEILTDKIDDIEKILNELNDGKDFKDIAAVYNKREWTLQSNGVWGFFNASSGGEIGRIAADLAIGQIYGPIKAPDGYSIFKLIDKKENIISEQIITGKENIKFVRIKLALGKMDKLISEKTVSLAKQYGISLNEQILNSLEISELNTFTYRLIGFGGKIAAFPITIPMFEWYKQYEQRKEIQ